MVVSRLIAVSMTPTSQSLDTNTMASATTHQPRYFSDEEISREFDGAYDQAHFHDGYEDDGDYAQPYRYLKNWSLWSSDGKAPNKQNPLPLPDGYFSPGTYLKGFVVPRDATKHDPLPVKIPLSSADYVTVDRSIRYRGFWIIISSPATLPDDATMPACYWLHEPDESIAPGAVKSQAQIHFDHRAWLAVLSNLIDALFPDFDKGAKYANQGVHEVHEMLKRGDDEPFDKTALVRYKDKIKPHLIGAQGYLTKTCVFVKSINSMRPPKARKNPKQMEELSRSTEAAESRSKQYPWGEPKLPVADANAAHRNNVDSMEPERSRQQRCRVGNTGWDSKHDTGVMERMDSSEQVKKPAAVTASTSSENDTLPRRRVTKGDAAAAAAAENAVAGEQHLLTEPENPLAQLNVTAFEKMATSKVKKSHGRLPNTDEYVASELDAKKSKKRALCGDTGSLQDMGDDKDSVGSSSKRKRKRLKQLAPSLRLPPFAGDEMGKALKFCGNFFSPKPVEDVDCSCWTKVEEHNFCLIDDKKAESLLQAAKDWGNNKGPEWYLLIVAAYRQSCLQVHNVTHKKIVQKVVGKKPMAKMMFNKWRNHAMDVLKKRQNKERSPLKVVEKSTEFLLLLNIVRLIVDCKLVNSKYTLDTLRNRGIDWQAIVYEVSAFNTETVGQSPKLQEACTAAQNRLNEINEQSCTYRDRYAADPSNAAGKRQRNRGGLAMGHEEELEGG